MAEAIKSYELEESFQQLPKPGSNRGEKALDYLVPILLSFAGDGSELEDIERLFSDKLLCSALELKSFDSTTLGKWLRRNRYGLRPKIKMAGNNLIRKIIKKSGLKELTYDPDAMMIESQKSTAQKTYKGFC